MQINCHNKLIHSKLYNNIHTSVLIPDVVPDIAPEMGANDAPVVVPDGVEAECTAPDTVVAGALGVVPSAPGATPGALDAPNATDSC